MDTNFGDICQNLMNIFFKYLTGYGVLASLVTDVVRTWLERGPVCERGLREIADL